ncbi:hypothetical protein [Streptomyces sp. CBMA29]|uniref:hypothetical protein n=1 Tax=Streptomyces sp. CBMA29 TaxID=1896314 RepID=UPI001661A02B|nr:hypothetical protein [Streptomyces sp. CBMA29]MBD0734268.1 hypothetical protein [Streptomyces sp. CBMA29]
MTIRIELLWDEKTTVGEVAQFIAQAKAAGAGPAAVIKDITHDQDPQLILGWRVEAPGDSTRVAPEVALPYHLMWNVHGMLKTIATGDGDVRGLQEAVAELEGKLWEELMS